jgi:hypothetical protein
MYQQIDQKSQPLKNFKKAAFPLLYHDIGANKTRLQCFGNAACIKFRKNILIVQIFLYLDIKLIDCGAPLESQKILSL